MGPVNLVLNRIDALNDQNVGLFKKEIQSRATNLFVTTPVEFTEIIKNIFMTPVHAASTILKTGIKATVLVTGSETMKKLDEKLPGFNDLVRTIYNVFAYAIGTFLSATVGVLFPNVNYKLHCALGLAVNPRHAVQVELTDDLTPEEQELIDNLNLAFAMARELEEEAKEMMQTEEKKIQHVFEETTITVENIVEKTEQAKKKT